MITGRSGDSLRQAQSVLAAEGGENCVLAACADMTQAAQIAEVVANTVSRFGRIDAAVANVGSGSVRGGWELDCEDWQSSLNGNLVGSMLFASLVLPHLARQPGASLTFISSIAGCEAIDAPLSYSAAKAALNSSAKALSRLMGPRGVRINTVAPGNVWFRGGRWEQIRSERGEAVERYIQTEVPMQRFGTPEEIANVVVFLASERASFVTGSCVVVDGGQTRS